MSARQAPLAQAVAEAPYLDGGPGDGPPESLVLDIGGEVGALIVYATEDCLGCEIDLTPAGAPRSHHLHTMIRRRRAPAREFVAGVYAEVTAGRYTLWGLDGAPLAVVDIVGGRVAEFDAGDCRRQRPAAALADRATAGVAAS
jgi:hypothetical protein